MSQLTRISITDKIAQAEVEFFKSEVREPQFLILTPDAYVELLLDLDKDITDNICHYMGLTIAITTSPDCLGLDEPYMFA